jgi:hypothetical protein
MVGYANRLGIGLIDDRIAMLFAAVRRSLLAHRGLSLRRKICRLLD